MNFEQADNRNESALGEGYLDTLRSIIRNAPEAIEKNCWQQETSWLSCFEAELRLIEQTFMIVGEEEHLHRKAFEKAQENLRTLKSDFEELKKDYPDNESTIPDKLKQKLIQNLDILG